VSSVKNQGKCGSCAAFATLAAFEVCYKKITGESVDFSEQQLVDCGYKHAGAKGCIGAPQHAYADWLATKKPALTTEKDYPYKGAKTKLKCPKSLPPVKLGARVAKAYYTYNGTEELLRKLVLVHGAAVATLTANGPLSKYTGGIFAGCEPGKKVDHAVTVVGYGREKGVDFWLLKNEWGVKWGENGYIRLKRGVGMCGIGKSFAALDCEAVADCEAGDETCEDASGDHEDEEENE
jgi:C1A family cysteine protease